MKVQGKHFRTIWLKEDDDSVVQIIDQRHLPHKFVIEDLTTVKDMHRAIRDMHLRGAIVIGVAAAYGMYLATLEAPRGSSLEPHFLNAAEYLKSARPTAVNLEWGVDEALAVITQGTSADEQIELARLTAERIAEDEVERSQQIGLHGLKLIEEIVSRNNGRKINVLTHCNAGWLACVDHGTATAPIYKAFEQGIDIHVWVDETRPRNQGARLTAWELGEQGVEHTVIADNVGGHLMQHGLVDLVLVGTDRTTRSGDVCNKIGTYLKALAAKDNDVPFYVALPSSSIDWKLREGVRSIPIEERDAEEVKYIKGLFDGKLVKVQLAPSNSPAANYAFDVTPARLVTGLITERGVVAANEEEILNLHPEHKND